MTDNEIKLVEKPVPPEGTLNAQLRWHREMLSANEAKNEQDRARQERVIEALELRAVAAEKALAESQRRRVSDNLYMRRIFSSAKGVNTRLRKRIEDLEHRLALAEIVGSVTAPVSRTSKAPRQ